MERWRAQPDVKMVWQILLAAGMKSTAYGLDFSDLFPRIIDSMTEIEETEKFFSNPPISYSIMNWREPETRKTSYSYIADKFTTIGDSLSRFLEQWVANRSESGSADDGSILKFLGSGPVSGLSLTSSGSESKFSTILHRFVTRDLHWHYFNTGVSRYIWSVDMPTWYRRWDWNS